MLPLWGAWVSKLSIWLLILVQVMISQFVSSSPESGSVLSAQSPMQGLNPQTVRSWPEPKSRVRSPTDSWASQAFFLMFIDFWEREQESAHTSREGAKRDGDTVSEVGSVLRAESPMWGLNSQTMTSLPELKPRVGRLTDWATQVPHSYLFNRNCLC